MQDYEYWPEETKNIAVSYGVEISTDYYFVLSQSIRLTDRWTDIRTDRQTDGRADGRMETDVDSKTVHMHS